VPQSTVTLDLQYSNAASLDRQISGAVAEVGRQLWTVALEQLKEVVEAERPSCTACGGALKLASSGPMEKAIDVLASRRLKSRGMSWRRPRAHHMVRLRLLRLNNLWDEFWNQRCQAQRRKWPGAA
jgi:hypothetical protein